MATLREVGRVFALLGEAYPDHLAKIKSDEQLSNTIRLYHRILEDVPNEVLEAATLQHIATSQWFPKVSELRNIAYSLSVPERRTGLEAWGDVQKAIRRVGHYGTPVFDDPLVDRAVRAIGWRELCLTTLEDAVADRARFIQAYEQMANREERTDKLLPQVAQLVNNLRMDRIPSPEYTRLISGGDEKD